MSVLAVRKCLENRSRLVIDKVTPALASVTQTGPGSSCLCMLNFKDVALRNMGWGEGGCMKLNQPSIARKPILGKQISSCHGDTQGG